MNLLLRVGFALLVVAIVEARFLPQGSKVSQLQPSFVEFKDEKRLNLEPTSQPPYAKTTRPELSDIPAKIKTSWVPECDYSRDVSEVDIPTQEVMKAFEWNSKLADETQKKMCGVRGFYVRVLMKYCASTIGELKGELNGKKKTYKGYETVLAYSIGSTSFTSDFDISLMGRNADILLSCFLTNFQDVWKKSSAVVFDTNLYADQIIIDKYFGENPSLLPCPCYAKELRTDSLYSMTAVLMRNSDARRASIAEEHRVALAKFVMYHSENMRGLTESAEAIKARISSFAPSPAEGSKEALAKAELLASVDSAKDWVTSSLADFLSEERDYINKIDSSATTYRYEKYQLKIADAYTFMKALQANDAALPSKCAELRAKMNVANALAMEAYFTQGALEEVVLTGQAGDRVVLMVMVYFDAFIENLADTLKMLHHQHPSSANDAIMSTHKYGMRLAGELAVIVETLVSNKLGYSSRPYDTDFSVGFNRTFFNRGFGDALRSLERSYTQVKVLKTLGLGTEKTFTFDVTDASLKEKDKTKASGAGITTWANIVSDLNSAWKTVRQLANPSATADNLSDNSNNSRNFFLNLGCFALLRYRELARAPAMYGYEQLIPTHRVE